MKINKAVITAAGRNQQTLPLQTLIDSDGTEKSVLKILIEEVLRADVEEICLVIQAGDEKAYSQVAGEHSGRLHFVQQEQSLGYGHALYSAKDFLSGDPFLHLVGDHLYVSRTKKGCAQHLVEVAANNSCSVSAVQAIRETLLPYYGVIGGLRMSGTQDLYKIDTVMEKPTPTQAEQQLSVPGLRVGHYLCFFGMHVLTSSVIDILEKTIKNSAGQKVPLSPALNKLAEKEQYLALQKEDSRYDVGVKYGLLNAQIALALNGQDRDEVLTNIVELLASRELKNLGR